MADGATVEVKGLKELSQALQELPRHIQGKALGAAVKAGADIIRDQAKANVAILTGATQKNIVAYRAKGSKPDDITYEVGITMKKKYPRRIKKAKSGTWGRIGSENWPPFYWRFLEFGTRKMAARPFLRPAWTNRSGEALIMIQRMLAAAVEIAAAKVPKYSG